MFDFNPVAPVGEFSDKAKRLSFQGIRDKGLFGGCSLAIKIQAHMPVGNGNQAVRLQDDFTLDFDVFDNGSSTGEQVRGNAHGVNDTFCSRVSDNGRRLANQG